MNISQPDAGNKRCIHCKQTLPISDYHCDRTKADGRRNACKRCQIAAVKAYQRANSANIKRTKRLYRIANAEKLAADYRAFIAANPDYHRNHYALNRESELTRKRDAAKAHKEQHNDA
jgi:hypothetical protein